MERDMPETVITTSPAAPLIRTAVEFAEPGPRPGAGPAAIEIRNASLFYGRNQALHDVSMDIPEKRATAFIGPSGCGKSTLLRCLNRMNDLIDNVRITGQFLVRGQDIYGPSTDVIEVRRRVGMVFQKSNPLPKSIYENVVYGLRIAGIRDKATLNAASERSLRSAAPLRLRSHTSSRVALSLMPAIRKP